MLQKNPNFSGVIGPVVIIVMDGYGIPKTDVGSAIAAAKTHAHSHVPGHGCQARSGHALPSGHSAGKNQPCRTTCPTKAAKRQNYSRWQRSNGDGDESAD